MKELHFDQEARNGLISGIEKISKAVKSTMGAMGRTVIIGSPHHTHGLTVTKDGVTVARSIELGDSVEDLAVRMVKEAASRTATSAGDGTTTAIVLTEAIVNAGINHIEEGDNVTRIIREINEASEKVIKNLTKKSKKVSGKTLRDVATISSNNDKVLGKLIADTYAKVGKDGIVTVEKSSGSKTFYEVTNGIKVDRGYTSRLFINNHKNDECVFDDAYVMVTDMEIVNYMAIEGVLKECINSGKPLLIIGTCSQNLLNTLAANVVQRGIKICNIIPPQFGYKTKELMQDIAITVGAKYFSESTGDNLSLMTVADLGVVKKVVVGSKDTVLIKDSDNDAVVSERIKSLWDRYNTSQDGNDRSFLKERIASLSGGVGVVYVGGNSDIEQKELYDRVDDAVCAVRSAIEEGILPGGGIALLHESFLMGDSDGEVILSQAILEPLFQICRNANIDHIDVYEYLSSEMIINEGLDVVTNRYGDMYKMGIIDPCKVTKDALRNAVSVACTILSTNCVINESNK